MGSPLLAFFQGMKTAGKQDETWVVNRLVKQLTDMGFPVTALSRSAAPPARPPARGPVVPRPRLRCVTGLRLGS